MLRNCERCGARVSLSAIYKWTGSGADDLVCTQCQTVVLGGGWLFPLHVFWGLAIFVLVLFSERITDYLGLTDGAVVHIGVSLLIWIVLYFLSLAIVFGFAAKR